VKFSGKFSGNEFKFEMNSRQLRHRTKKMLVLLEFLIVSVYIYDILIAG